jgi:hypothetical protein
LQIIHYSNLGEKTMLHEMNSELFVELTEEQAQVVTGGSYGSYPDIIKDNLSTHFNQRDRATLLEVTQVSGPGGSANVQKFANLDRSIDTAAYKDVFAKLY